MKKKKKKKKKKDEKKWNIENKWAEFIHCGIHAHTIECLFVRISLNDGLCNAFLFNIGLVTNFMT